MAGPGPFPSQRKGCRKLLGLDRGARTLILVRQDGQLDLIHSLQSCTQGGNSAVILAGLQLTEWGSRSSWGERVGRELGEPHQDVPHAPTLKDNPK